MNILFSYLKSHALVFVSSIGIAAALSVTSIPSEISKAGAAVADNVMSILRKRSPGARAHGSFSDTKATKLKRTSRVRPQTQEARAPLSANFVSVGSIPDSQPFVLDAPEISVLFVNPVLGVSPLSLASFIPSAGAGGVGPTILVGGGGGTSGGGGGGGGGGTPPPTVITPIPEPTTWLSMIVGFGLTGKMLRKIRSNKRTRFAHV